MRKRRLVGQRTEIRYVDEWQNREDLHLLSQGSLLWFEKMEYSLVCQGIKHETGHYELKQNFKSSNYVGGLKV